MLPFLRIYLRLFNGASGAPNGLTARRRALHFGVRSVLRGRRGASAPSPGGSATVFQASVRVKMVGAVRGDSA
jgi:hypothetical protein